jgi:hypothetical protein
VAAEDLISLADRTTDEQQEIATKGGIASGKARREKKAMRETLEILLTMPLKDGSIEQLEEIQSIASLKGKNITVQEAIMFAQIQRALKGNTRAAEYIRDTSGNKLREGLLDYEEQQARIEKLKAETAKIKGEVTGDEMQDDGFMDALRSEVGDTWAEE